MCYPQQLGRSWRVFGYLPRKLPEPHQPFAPEPSGTSSAFCPGTLQNLVCYLHRNPPELHQLSAPEPSTTSSAICTGTLQNFVYYLHRDSAEPHQPFAAEPSGTSSAICTRTAGKPSAPEPSGTSSAICPGTLRNLVLQLHRITPELFWAKDPIASFAVGGKKKETLASF